jgi:NADPH2:quinone reductase
VIAAVVSDGRLELLERPTPQPVADQVLVEVAGSGVNRADLLQRRGLYPAPAGWPEDIPGLELSGRVVEVGPMVTTLHAGDRVCGIVGGGSHATHILTTEALCVPVPAGIDLIEAGGIPEVFITAHDALTAGRLRAGERLLIHGVGSGVGTAAVQLAAAMGATIVGTARTPEKLERAKELGLDEGVHASDDMAALIGEVDLVLDLVGGHYLKVDVEACRTKGRIVVVGLLAGSSVELDFGVVMRKRLSIFGTVLRSRPEWEKASATAAFAHELIPLLERKLVRPVVDRVVPFDEIQSAYDALQRNETFGKIVVAMGG